MNLDANPCDDFYEFACGKFLKEAIIPDDKTQSTAFHVIYDKLRENLRLIVQEPINETEAEPFKNVKRLYQACTDVNLIEARGTSDLDSLTAQWPVVTKKNVSADWTWQKSVEESKNSGYSSSNFFSFSVSTDNKNSTKRVVRIDQPNLALSRQYLIKLYDDPFFLAYWEYQVEIAVLLGASRSDAETAMDKVVKFESKLANISMASEDRRNADLLYNPFTIAELQSKWNYEGMNWLQYFNALLPAEAQLQSNDQVIVGAVSFFDQFGHALIGFSKETLANYAIWRRVMASISYMPKKFREVEQVYTEKLTGRAVENPRWLDCIDTSLRYYPHALGSLYVRKHFKEEAKEKVIDMVKNVKDEFTIMLNEIEWMDQVTKAAAKIKAEKIAEQIAYADELIDDSKLVKYYDTWPVTINETKYFESIFALNKASTDRSWKRLREAIDKNEWTSFITPAIVDAFYSPPENTIKLPAGILQGVFFNAERPTYMNYGAIGLVIGHEITHGFDDQGSQYNGDGNLINWWANETRQAYLEKARCMIEQYGNYTEPTTGLNLNGINTQGENIADNGGIKESYRAYNRWAKNNHEKKLPGLDFSHKQMFWIPAAQIWCSIYRAESMRNAIQTGVHSPGQFRVIGPMSNMKEFSEDFQCKLTDKMNPSKKCEVW